MEQIWRVRGWSYIYVRMVCSCVCISRSFDMHNGGKEGSEISEGAEERKLHTGRAHRYLLWMRGCLPWTSFRTYHHHQALIHEVSGGEKKRINRIQFESDPLPWIRSMIYCDDIKWYETGVYIFLNWPPKVFCHPIKFSCHRECTEMQRALSLAPITIGMRVFNSRLRNNLNAMTSM